MKGAGHEEQDLEGERNATRRTWFVAAGAGDLVALARLHALQPGLIDQAERVEVGFFPLLGAALPFLR